MFTKPLDELRRLFSADKEASGAGEGQPLITIEEYSPDLLTGWAEILPAHARKGGAISGGAIFSLFDGIGYIATLAQSPTGTEAFTTDVTIHYLRSGPLGRVTIEARPLKFGRRAAVTSVTIYSPAVPDGPIASGIISFAPRFRDD